jgi:hypothetical protein
MLFYCNRIIFFNRNIIRYLISFFIFSIYIDGFNYHLKPYKIKVLMKLSGIRTLGEVVNDGNNGAYLKA